MVIFTAKSGGSFKFTIQSSCHNHNYNHLILDYFKFSKYANKVRNRSKKMSFSFRILEHILFSIRTAGTPVAHRNCFFIHMKNNFNSSGEKKSNFHKQCWTNRERIFRKWHPSHRSPLHPQTCLPLASSHTPGNTSCPMPSQGGPSPLSSQSPSSKLQNSLCLCVLLNK